MAGKDKAREIGVVWFWRDVFDACEDGFDFGGEKESPAIIEIIEGFDSEAVAAAEEGLFFCVPECKGPHAIEARNEVLSPIFVGFEDDFGIAGSEEGESGVAEFVLQFDIVVDFAVEDNPEAARGGSHGLRAGVGEIQDGESAMAESEGDVIQAEGDVAAMIEGLSGLIEKGVTEIIGSAMG